MQMYMKLIQSGFTMRGLVHVVVRTVASVFATRRLLLYILHSIVFDVIQLRVKQSNKTSNIEYIYIFFFYENGFQSLHNLNPHIGNFRHKLLTSRYQRRRTKFLMTAVIKDSSAITTQKSNINKKSPRPHPLLELGYPQGFQHILEANQSSLRKAFSNAMNVGLQKK